MKYISPLILLITLGCASEEAPKQEPAPTPVVKEEPKPDLPPCSTSPLKGVWNAFGGIAIFNSDCTWTSSDCSESGTYTNSSENPDYTTVEVLKSSCKDPKVYLCNYAIKENALYTNCSIK